MEYDVMDRLVHSLFPDGRVATNLFDAVGRLIKETGAGDLPAKYSYNPVGDLIALTDGENHVTGFDVDCLGRLTRKTFADGTHWDYTYNSRWWLVRLPRRPLPPTASTLSLSAIARHAGVGVSAPYTTGGRMAA